MVQRSFVTIPDELLVLAGTAADHFEMRGYTVQVEPSDVTFPRTPALVCTRRLETLILEVDLKADSAKFANWSNYARSSQTDVRVGIVVPSDVALTAADEAKIRKLGLGVYSVV